MFGRVVPSCARREVPSVLERWARYPETRRILLSLKTSEFMNDSSNRNHGCAFPGSLHKIRTPVAINTA